MLMIVWLNWFLIHWETTYFRLQSISNDESTTVFVINLDRYLRKPTSFLSKPLLLMMRQSVFLLILLRFFFSLIFVFVIRSTYIYRVCSNWRLFIRTIERRNWVNKKEAQLKEREDVVSIDFRSILILGKKEIEWQTRKKIRRNLILGLNNWKNVNNYKRIMSNIFVIERKIFFPKNPTFKKFIVPWQSAVMYT